MRHHWTKALGTLALCCATGSGLAADPAQPSPAPAVVSPDAGPAPVADWSGGTGDSGSLAIAVGERTWFTMGDSKWSFSGPGGHPNILSELKWQDIDSTVFEFNLDAVLANRFVSRTDLGFGGLDEGHLRDTDYNGDNRTAPFSDSLSGVNDESLFYVSQDFGYRLFSRPTLAVDVLAGYQYWREQYADVNGVSLLPPGFLAPGVGIREVFERHNLRAGGRVRWLATERLDVEARVMLVPWSHQEVVDTHYDRPDLAQPSSKAITEGGFGVMADLSVSYQVWRGLAVFAGYQVWEMTSGRGAELTFHSDSTTTNTPLNEIETLRHGAIVGVLYRF